MTNSGQKTDNKSKISIVFFGSGPVAAASLELLLQDFSVEAVVTKPRPPHHRGSVPVLELAAEKNLRVIEAGTKKELSAKIAAEKFASRVAVLIDFGIIVAQDVINAFPLGIINSHFSLLPEWRGADPITFAILSGQERTGVSLMKLVEAMDAGPILSVGVQPLDSTFTTPKLTESLIHLSYGLLKRELPRYIEGASVVEQSELPNLITDFPYPATLTYSRKLTKEDGVLDFNKSAAVLEREIRAYAEWPKSRMSIAGVDCVVTAAHVAPTIVENVDKKSTFIANKQLCVQTSDGVLIIDRLKPAGKPEMPASAFLAGYSSKL